MIPSTPPCSDQRQDCKAQSSEPAAASLSNSALGARMRRQGPCTWQVRCTVRGSRVDDGVPERQYAEESEAASTEAEDDPLPELLAVQQRGRADRGQREQEEGHGGAQEHRNQRLRRMLPDHRDLRAVAPLGDE
eukprot:CAMPEP_0115255264 /NCGR_PEP_ID=MMETSP0270-20121206/45624_1 /TAXON_ID=71861 /ORGANISM="Scrippsiella trochoidea, Strain CCMP3099" /LENGTH=133 /DNA_ID=CAMNT_0002670847 /DNA_START=32 /DNA_END=430 /DNA_ORIENTATION=+